MGWYVVETEPTRRGQVDWAVRDAIKALGFETLLLETPHLTPPKYRFAPPAILVLPRYVFAQFDLANDQNEWPEILGIQGVKTLLGMATRGGIPSSVREKDFERLQELAANLANQEIAAPAKITPLAKEVIVRILWAPFAGAIGKIEFDNGIRADVLLETAGVASKVSLPRELIEAI